MNIYILYVDILNKSSQLFRLPFSYKNTDDSLLYLFKRNTISIKHIIQVHQCNIISIPHNGLVYDSNNSIASVSVSTDIINNQINNNTNNIVLNKSNQRIHSCNSYSIQLDHLQFQFIKFNNNYKQYHTFFFFFNYCMFGEFHDRASGKGNRQKCVKYVNEFNGFEYIEYECLSQTCNKKIQIKPLFLKNEKITMPHIFIELQLNMNYIIKLYKFLLYLCKKQLVNISIALDVNKIMYKKQKEYLFRTNIIKKCKFIYIKTLFNIKCIYCGNYKLQFVFNLEKHGLKIICNTNNCSFCIIQT